MKRLLSLGIACILSFVGSFAFSQDEPTVPTESAQLTEAEQREQKVVDRFWSLLEKSPRRGTSLDRVYGYYVDTGRMDDLLKRCREKTEAAPDDAKSWLLLGLILSRRSDDAATIEALEKAKTRDEAEPLSAFYLGETYIAQGRLKDAAETLEIALQRSVDALQKGATDATGVKTTTPKDVLAVLQTLGRVYERFGDQENSAKIWNKLEEFFPGDRDILVRIAETLEEEGKFDEALKRYQQLAQLAKDDNFARVQYTLAAADIKIRLGEKQAAIDDFEQLLDELSGESWLAQSIRDRVERIFVRQADYAGLAGYYQKRLQKHPNDLDTIRRLAIALVRLSRTEEAKTLLAETLEKAPSNIPLRLALIDLLVADRDFEAVDGHYAKIDEIQPNNPDHVSQWGLAVLENTKLDENARKAAAVKIWSRLLAARPDDPATIIMVADLMNSGKIYDEAEKLYKKAVELRPTDPGFKEYLGYFYHHREQKDKAVATLKQIAEGERKSAPNLAQLGGILKSLGYDAEAIDAMKDAVALKPDDFELRMQYGDLLAANEKFDEAEKEFLEAEKLAVRTDSGRTAAPNEEFGRFLRSYTKLLQSSLRLNEVTEKLDTELAEKKDATAFDFWRLATYRAAMGRMDSATDSIEKAIEKAPGSNILLEAAADIFEKGNDQIRAAEIYEKLVQSDPQRRVDHLKRLANLRRDLGEMDRAIETARLVMATGAGNAANSRFYADMLIGIGRRKDGIEALRRAVRLDPTDTTTLSALADILYDSDQSDEAMEILWRIFERTEELQSKMGVVNRMSAYYQQSQRFDQLIERLRQNADDAASRRESAYCLAQAYISVSDFDAARQTLEMLLLGADAGDGASSNVASGGTGKTTDDTLLLSQLSKIAEEQADMPSAIRYQEMLCDQAQSGPENERLLALYKKSGEKEKAIDHLIKFFVEKGELREQIQAVDDLLASEDYESAAKILGRIASKNPDNWEILYRRLMLEYWQAGLDGNLDDAEKTALEILKLNTARDELSAKKEHEKNSAKPATSQTSSQRYNRYSGGRSPWGFGPHGSHHYWGGMDGVQMRWNQTASQLFPTLFREKLQLEQTYYYQSGALSTEPPKPQYEPENFGDARFAAEIWRLKIAMQRDLDAFRKEHPAEEGKPETAATEKNGLKFDRFTQVIDDLRASLPADAQDVQPLLDRLRLENFFTQWKNQTVDQNRAAFSEGNYAKILFTLKDTATSATSDSSSTDSKDDSAANREAAVQRLCSKIQLTLALKGEKEWFTSAYDAMLSGLWTAYQVREIEKYDIEKEFDEALKKAADNLRKTKFTDEQIADCRKYFLERIDAVRKEYAKIQAADSMTLEQKIDLIFQCWELALASTLDERNQYFMVFHSYSRLKELFRLMEREDDVRRLDEIVEKATRENPAAELFIVQNSFDNIGGRSEDPATFWGVANRMYNVALQHGQNLIVPIKPGDDALNSQTMLLMVGIQNAGILDEIPSYDKQFEGFSTNIKRLREAAEKVKKESEGKNVLPGQNIAVAVAENVFSPSGFDGLTTGYLNRLLTPIQVFFDGGSNQHLVTHHYGPGIVHRILSPNSTPEKKDEDAEKRKRKITQPSLDRITAIDKEIYRVLDFYFETLAEIETEKEPEKPVVAAPSKRVRAPNLSSYRSYFEHGQTLYRYEIDRILQGQSSSGGMIRYAQPVNQEQTLQIALRSMKYLDEITETADPESEVDIATLRKDHVERLEKYLDSQSEKTEIAKKHVENFRKIVAELEKSGGALAGGMGVQHYDNEVDIDKLLEELTGEEKELKEKGEKLSLNKMLLVAIIYQQKAQQFKALEYIDAMPLTSSNDIRYREQLALKWFAGLAENATMKKRATAAVDKLLGYQLKGDEMKDMRQTLRLLGRNEEADKMRDRMLYSATDLNTQYELLNELQGDANKERRIQFALKVFRSPGIRGAVSSQPNSYQRHIRDRVLEILKNDGKLGEIVEQVEAQWKSSPGSVDIMTALADIYHKAGRTDEAKKLAKEIGEKVPDDAAKMQAYANLLQNLGMNEESAKWMEKALLKNPEQLLNDFWQYENSYRNSKQTGKLLDLLLKIKPQRLAGQFGNIGHRVNEWLKDKDLGPKAKELIQYVWEMEGSGDAERKQLRSEFVRQLSYYANSEEYYPMFHEVIMDSISRPMDDSDDEMQTHYSSSNPFSAYTWSSDKCYCVGTTFFDLAEKKKILDETKKEFEKIIKEHEDAGKSTSQDKTRLRYARLCLAINEARLKNADVAVEILESLGDDPDPNMRHQSVDTVIALELAPLNDSKAINMAIRLLEGELKNNPNASHMERVLIQPLYKLYLKSDRPEQGRELALEKIRESFKYLKLCGSNHYYQVGNRYYQSYSLQESALAMSRSLIEADYAFDLMLIYREMYDGQAWVGIARKQNDYRYRELDQISKELESKISTKDFVKHLELMIPGMEKPADEKAGSDQTGAGKDEKKDVDLKSRLPIQLGRYVLGVQPIDSSSSSGNPLVDLLKMYGKVRKEMKDVADEKENLAGIRFADALKTVAGEEPERYAAIRTAIEKLEKEAPDDPSVLIALTCCRLIDGDRDRAEDLLRRCAEWFKSKKSSDEIDPQINLGFWNILKWTFADEELMKRPDVRENCRTLCGVVGRLITQLSADESSLATSARRNNPINQSSQVHALLTDVKRHAPDDFTVDYQAEFDSKVFQRLLMPQAGRLTRRLDSQRYRIAEQLAEGVSLGAVRPIMKAFESIFRDGWPPLEGGENILSRENSMYLLKIFGQVLDAAARNNADPNIVFESLLEIVLPADKNKTLFLGDYNDLGGENGFFRTMACPLVEWAIAANRGDDLKKRIAEKREQEESQKEQNSIRLDAVDFVLALKTMDHERTEKLYHQFFEAVKQGNVLAEKFALIVAVPCLVDGLGLENRVFPKSEPPVVSTLSVWSPPDAKLLQLVDAAVVQGSKDNRNRRYTYYTIRTLYDAFEKSGADIPSKIRWLERYRKITDQNQMDGFRFTKEDRLYREGLKAIEEDRLPDALTVLKYFAGCPADNFRYRNLSDYMDRFQSKLDALPEAERKELLGDFDLSAVARQGDFKQERIDEKTLKIPKFDLPDLPEGKNVYRNDFETETGPAWSIDRRDTAKKIDQTFLGEFYDENLRFRLDDLPEHRFVRIRFDLFILGGADGLVGASSEFGVDVWGMKIDGSAPPLISTFSNFRMDPNHQKQSFPDDYPPEFGVEPTWNHKIMSGDIWNDDLEKGYYHGREGAALENRFGYEKDAVYVIDMVVPHRDKELAVEFFTKFQDGPYGGGAISLAFGESWGLDNFRVDVIDQALELDGETLKKCFDALIGDDVSAAAAARWRLVAAENTSVEFMNRWFEDEANAAKRKEIWKKGNFDLFRIDRVLQLIATPEAEAFRKTIRL